MNCSNIHLNYPSSDSPSVEVHSSSNTFKYPPIDLLSRKRPAFNFNANKDFKRTEDSERVNLDSPNNNSLDLRKKEPKVAALDHDTKHTITPLSNTTENEHHKTKVEKTPGSLCDPFHQVSKVSFEELLECKNTVSFYDKLISLIDAWKRKELGFESQRRELKVSFEMCENTLRKLEYKLREISNNYKDSLIEIDRFQKLSVDYKSRLEECSNSNKMYEKQLQDMSNLEFDIEDFKKKIYSKFEESKNEIQKLNDALSNDQKQLNESTNEVNALKSVLIEKDSIIVNINNDLHNSTVEIHDLKCSFVKLGHDFTSLQEEMEACKGAVARFYEAFLNRIHTVKMGLEKKLIEYMHTMNEYDASLKSIQKEQIIFITKGKELWLLSKSTMAEKNELRCLYEQDMVYKDDRIMELQLALNRKESEISDYCRDHSEIKKLNEEVSNLNNENNSLRRELESVQESLKDSVEQGLKFNTEYEDMKKAYNLSLEALKTEASNYNTKIASLEQEISLLRSKSQEQHDTNRRSKDDPATNTLQPNDHIETIKNEYCEIIKVQKLKFDNERRQFENKCKSLENGLSELKKEKTALEENLTQLNSKTVIEKKENTEFNTTTNRSKPDISNIINSLERDLDNMTSELHHRKDSENRKSKGGLPMVNISPKKTKMEDSRGSIKNSQEKTPTYSLQGKAGHASKKYGSKKGSGPHSTHYNGKRITDCSESDIWSVLDSPNY